MEGVFILRTKMPLVGLQAAKLNQKKRKNNKNVNFFCSLRKNVIGWC